MASDTSEQSMQAFSAAQHTLMAFNSLYGEVSNGGFLQLIQNGYGSYIFDNPFSEHIKEWGAVEIAKIVDDANSIMRKLNSIVSDLPNEITQCWMGNGITIERMNTLKNDFLQEYPEMGAYVIYQQPNFKLRVGDFKTRLEASKFLTEMQTRFAMAFIVNDEVRLPNLD